MGQIWSKCSGQHGLSGREGRWGVFPSIKLGLPKLGLSRWPGIHSIDIPANIPSSVKWLWKNLVRTLKMMNSWKTSNKEIWNRKILVEFLAESNMNFTDDTIDIHHPQAEYVDKK